MKILFAPNLIVSGLSEADRARILEAAGPGARIVEAKDKATQRRELPDTDVIFGRPHPELFSRAARLVYYHSIGAGVDSILTPELVNSDVPLASEKGEVGIHLAEHAFALLLALTRGLHTAIRTQDYELRDWAESLNTTPDRIKKAVRAVGDLAEKVREYLRGK